jgi:hypothetical protein
VVVKKTHQIFNFYDIGGDMTYCFSKIVYCYVLTRKIFAKNPFIRDYSFLILLFFIIFLLFYLHNCPHYGQSHSLNNLHNKLPDYLTTFPIIGEVHWKRAAILPSMSIVGRCDIGEVSAWWTNNYLNFPSSPIEKNGMRSYVLTKLERNVYRDIDRRYTKECYFINKKVVFIRVVQLEGTTIHIYIGEDIFLFVVEDL